MQHTITHDENVFSGAFGNVTFVVQQQGFLGTTGNGLVQGQHRVNVVAVRLGLAHGDIDVVARVGGRAHLDPHFLRFR